MIPEVKITCRETYFFNSVTVKQYKKYVGLMEKNNSDRMRETMFFNRKIVQELFENRVSAEELENCDAMEFLYAVKTIHFIMQNIVTEKIVSIADGERVEKEESAFDEYDLENGYEETEQPEENQWKICNEIVNRIVKIAIRLLKNSYSQCMNEDIVELADYLKFELDTIEENR